ncbi:MAG: exonuclease domain-containing protein [Myxococcales bacterium]|nr:exonuclease domain-containing protein [Myxococcales bacterium]
MRPYLVIDLEATCDDGPLVPRGQMEIIEIGAVLVDGADLIPIATFQTFVRPVRHPRLTPFCVGLTTIQQADVDAAPRFPEALAALTRFMQQGQPPGDPPPLFASWGRYDRGQFELDARLHGVTLPFGGEHLNLKQAFSDRLGTRKLFGMHRALARSGLRLDGTHHRGLDDARNIAKLLPFCVGAFALPPPPAGWRSAHPAA